MARVFTFEDELELATPREETFAFFAEARNLEAITPPFLRFEVLTPPPIAMKEGALIDYQLRLHGIPLRWRTRIAAWEPPHRFVDEQLRGPYRRWEHEHTFEATEVGTRLRDRVRYSVLGGWLVDRLLVRRDVARIFRYRKARLQALLEAPRAAGWTA